MRVTDIVAHARLQPLGARDYGRIIAIGTQSSSFATVRLASPFSKTHWGCNTRNMHKPGMTHVVLQLKTCICTCAACSPLRQLPSTVLQVDLSWHTTRRDPMNPALHVPLHTLPTGLLVGQLKTALVRVGLPLHTAGHTKCLNGQEDQHHNSCYCCVGMFAGRLTVHTKHKYVQRRTG